MRREGKGRERKRREEKEAEHTHDDQPLFREMSPRSALSHE